VGVVRGMLAEKKGEFTTARIYYTATLNFELYHALIRQTFPRDFNFSNFFYPYRFFLSQNNTNLVSGLDPIGRKLEQHLIDQQSSSGKQAIESELTGAKDAVKELKKELFRIRLRQLSGTVFKLLFFLYLLCFGVIFITAQVVVIRRTIHCVKRFDHLRVLGAILKVLELEGFVFIASIVFAPAALLLVFYSQIIQALLLAEGHLYRMSEHQRTGKGAGWLKLPLIYRDQD
jgi:hypothetical protein